MPSSKNYERNYRQEYDRYHAKPEQKENRASRNAARATLAKKGVVKKGDGQDVDHKNRNPKDNSANNLEAKPKSANRSFSRKANAKKYAKNIGASNPPSQRKYS